MEKINIKSSLYNYTVNFIDDFEKELEKFKKTTVYIIDKNVYHLYKNKFLNIDNSHIFLMDALENKKNMQTVMEIIEFLQVLGVRKDWKIVCIGGGITQDVTTIVSDLFLRNIEWSFFPTTLLSMCDSCIGGKCGINFKRYKNQIGVFYPPKQIFIDIRFITTLSDADYLNGWGEILKFSLSTDRKFFEELKNEKNFIPCKKIKEYINKGLNVKKNVIEMDEFESDYRRILNYGHTFGHALEAYTCNDIPHGKAVIWGIDVANYISLKQGLISADYYYEIKSLIKRNFLKKEIEILRPKELFDIIKTDKKVKANKINFALLDGQSHLIVYSMSIDDKLEKLFINYLGDTHEYYSN